MEANMNPLYCNLSAFKRVTIFKFRRYCWIRRKFKLMSLVKDIFYIM